MIKKQINSISCVLIVKNAQSTIKQVLEALNTFNDVIVYSNNSTDNTNKLAKAFSNVTLIEGEFIGFGPTKNLAASYAKNEWILSLDADEVVSSEFISNLLELDVAIDTVYTIKRTNYYKNSPVRHCWGDDVIIRLYNKTKTAFTDKKVHEKIISDNLTIQEVKGIVKHYPYATVTDFIVKLDRYSTIFAQDNVGQKKSSPSKAFFNGMFSFIKTYFFKKGFLDGYAGLIIAFSHMATNFYKYIKLYEMNKELEVK